MRVAGVMSGTSLDGIDVAIVDLPKIKTIGFHTTPYPAALRSTILAANTAEEISRLNFRLAELYAKAVLRAVDRFGPVELIGCHGQTVYHEGGRHTLQLGEPAVIAERTGAPVVSNFRARDIAAGGQGAPLVPFVDYLLFRHPSRIRVALNIGGIANITVLVPGFDVLAFDTGPGNMVIDALAREISGGKLAYDRDSKFARSGRVNKALLDQILCDPYYEKSPPKSCGREQYGAEFVARMKSSGLPLRDLIATATVLTAWTIAKEVAKTVAIIPVPTDLIVSGGGVHNPMLMEYLNALVPCSYISTSADYGIDADAKEAIAFAVLAYQTWRHKPGNLPSATGARKPVVLGSITR